MGPFGFAVTLCVVAASAVSTIYAPDAPTVTDVKQDVASILRDPILWKNAHAVSSDPEQKAAQHLLSTQGTSVKAVRTDIPKGQLYDIVNREFNLTNDTVKLILQHYDKQCPAHVLVVQQFWTQGTVMVYNSVTIGCNEAYWQSVAVNATALRVKIDMKEQIVFGNTSTSPTGDTLLLLSAMAVSRALGIPPLAFVGEGLGSFPGFMNSVDIGVTSMVNALKELAEAFGSHSKSAIVSKDQCLRFDSMYTYVEIHSVQCYQDAHISEYIDVAFPDLIGLSNKTFVEQMMLEWKYAYASNVSLDEMQLSNTGTSYDKILKVLKSHDEKLPCSHWVIVRFTSDFKVAMDMFIWEKTKSSWFGMKTTDTESIQYLPHHFSPDDIESIHLLMDILVYGAMAKALGIPFVWPNITGCHDDVSVEEDMSVVEDTAAESIVNASSESSAMAEAISRLNVSYNAKDAARLVKNISVTMHGSTTPKAVRNVSEINLELAQCDVPPSMVKSVDMYMQALFDAALDSDKFFGTTINVTKTEASVWTLTGVGRRIANDTVTFWLMCLETTGVLIQQTQTQNDHHCWHCAKCGWLDKCCCEDVPHQVPRPDTASELMTVTARLLAAQYDWYHNRTMAMIGTARDVTWQWAETAWAVCNKMCGGGTQSRSVYCISSNGAVDPTGTKCNASSKPAVQQACNTIPCSGQYLVSTIVNQTNNLLKTLPTSPPANAPVKDMSTTGAYDVVGIPPSQVSTVLNAWTVANQWPPEVANMFQKLVNVTSERYTGFFFVLSSAVDTWTTIVGAARGFNDTADMAYISAVGKGTTIQQHYGNEKSVGCGQRCATSYSNPVCMTNKDPSNCGQRIAPCPGEPAGKMCPADCACPPPCTCDVLSPSIPGQACTNGNFGCDSMLGTGALQKKIRVQEPGSCYMDSNGDMCWMQPGPGSDVMLDWSGCRDPGHLAQCDKPLTVDQATAVSQALQATARPQIPSQVNLLAVRLEQPPPYPHVE